MIINKIYFEAEDGVELFGLLHTPTQTTKEVLISVHGFASDCMKKREDILAHEFTANNIAYFAFNNRGATMTTSLSKKINGKIKKEYFGASYEDVLDSYHDIKAAIKHMLELGYSKIHLQGHSLGCLKVVYTYNRFINNKEDELLNVIKSVILLSMVDIQDITEKKISNYKEIIESALTKEKNGELDYLLKASIAGRAVTVKTYLRYFKYNQDISFPRYSDDSYDYQELRNIKCPLFMRWGNINEDIIQDVEDLVELVSTRLSNNISDINYIDGANHSYEGKEELLAKEEIEFIGLYRK